MKTNLVGKWPHLESAELRIVLRNAFASIGQYDGRVERPDKIFLPEAGPKCRIILTFKEGRVTQVSKGPAFDRAEWARIANEIETSVLVGPSKIARFHAFSSFRVKGSWRGTKSRVQISPPLENMPVAPVELADHPFILEFPIRVSGNDGVTRHRFQREYRSITNLLNVLLIGRTGHEPLRHEHFWANVAESGQPIRIAWVQQFFWAPIGESITSGLSPVAGKRIEKLDPATYYDSGHDGRPLCVPTDLDEQICCYQCLSERDRDRFDRAAHWIDLASRQWFSSVSASYASLAVAIEALAETADGTATQQFIKFLETYAPGKSNKRRREEMYDVRSGILHGNRLMQLDEVLDFGPNLPQWRERALHDELWQMTTSAARAWISAQSQ
ncbi:MAG: hypothetical protein ACYC96_16105 [Fimbriimonadaceae bacterium]